MRSNETRRIHSARLAGGAGRHVRSSSFARMYASTGLRTHVCVLDGRRATAFRTGWNDQCRRASSENAGARRLAAACRGRFADRGAGRTQASKSAIVSSGASASWGASPGRPRAGSPARAGYCPGRRARRPDRCHPPRARPRGCRAAGRHSPCRRRGSGCTSPPTPGGSSARRAPSGHRRPPGRARHPPSSRRP